MHESDVMVSTRVLEEDLIQVVFDGLSEEDESDNDEDNEIYAFLGAPTVRRADLTLLRTKVRIKKNRRTNLIVLI